MDLCGLAGLMNADSNSDLRNQPTIRSSGSAFMKTQRSSGSHSVFGKIDSMSSEEAVIESAAYGLQRMTPLEDYEGGGDRVGPDSKQVQAYFKWLEIRSSAKKRSK